MLAAASSKKINQRRVFRTAHRRACVRRLWGGGPARKLSARARRVTVILVRPFTAKEHCAGKGPLSFRARPWCDMPATASNAKPAPHVTRRRRAGARCLRVERAAHELAARACRAALAAAGSSFIEGHRSGEKPFPLDKLPWCSNAMPATRVSRGAQARLRSPPLDRRRSTQAFCARAPCRAGSGRPVHYEKALHRQEASLFRRAAAVRHASYGLQCQASAA